MAAIKSFDDLPRRPANLADPAPVYPWPEGYGSALFLSFDVDAESAWTAKNPDNFNRLIAMSYGGFEARVGTPRLLDLLRELDLRATFFITGWTLDAHPAMCEAILEAGHEIGHHGYHHLTPEPGSARLIEEVDQGLDALKRRLGVVPKGYRAPSGEFCEELRAALTDRGIVYTSSFRDDVRPYRHRLEDGRPGPIELPPTASYDDWMLGMSAPLSPRPIFPSEHVLSIWRDELDETREWGALVTTVWHPQCSGRPMRFKLVRDFLNYAKSHPDVWITTGEAIAENFLRHEKAAT